MLSVTPKRVSTGERPRGYIGMKEMSTEQRRSRLIGIVLVTSMLMASVVLSGGTAIAATSVTVSPEEASSAIDNMRAVAPGLVLDAHITKSEDSFVHKSDGGSVVTISNDPSEGVLLDTAAGINVVVTVLSSEELDSTTVDATGLVSYAGTDGYTTSVLAADGGAQFLTTIADATAPREYIYNLTLPEGATLIVDEESGGAVARTSEGRLLLLVAPPWAFDATGAPVETRFGVSGHSLTQVIEHKNFGVTYPVVADPTVNGRLIKSYRWIRSGRHWKISVAVTPAMGWASVSTAAIDGWAELKAAVRKRSATEYRRLNTRTMQHQWICHAIGKAAIGVAGWLGIDKSPTWDLENWRKPLSGNIWSVAGDMVIKRCNW